MAMQNEVSEPPSLLDYTLHKEKYGISKKEFQAWTRCYSAAEVKALVHPVKTYRATHDPVPAEVKAERRKNVLLVIGKLFLKTVKWVFLIFATFLAAIFSLAFERNPRQKRG